MKSGEGIFVRLVACIIIFSLVFYGGEKYYYIALIVIGVLIILSMIKAFIEMGRLSHAEDYGIYDKRNNVHYEVGKIKNQGVYHLIDKQVFEKHISSDNHLQLSEKEMHNQFTLENYMVYDQTNNTYYRAHYIDEYKDLPSNTYFLHKVPEEKVRKPNELFVSEDDLLTMLSLRNRKYFKFD